MFARTDRLLLRPGWTDDAAELYSAIAHESVAMKLARLPWPYTVADARDFLSIPRKENEAVFVIVLRTESGPRLIGGIGLHSTDDGTLELGYWLSPAHWGKGYVTEAGRAVIDIARHSLKQTRLVAGHFIDNPASGRILTKLGFKPTGRIEPRHCLARGEDVPCVLFEQALADDDLEGPVPSPQPIMRLAA